MKLLSVQNAKTTKGESLGYLTGILYLAPHAIAGPTVCPASTEGCRQSCLFHAGRGRFKNVHEARIRKTKAWHADPNAFIRQLSLDIRALKRKAAKLGLIPCVRLNGTSDISWETTGIMSLFPSVQFYDYTKRADRALQSTLSINWPSNYHITFSASESTPVRLIDKMRAAGVSVAVVMDKMPTMAECIETLTIDGTQHDLRFLDPKGCIVALLPKGPAKRDKTGFVKRSA